MIILAKVYLFPGILPSWELLGIMLAVGQILDLPMFLKEVAIAGARLSS